VISETEHRTIDQISPAQPEGEISILGIFIVLAHRKGMILKVFFVIVLITIVICLLLPNEFTATTTLLPPQQSGSAGAALLSQLGGLGSLVSAGLPMKNPNDLQVALLRSQTVEDAMVDRFHIMDRTHAKRRSEARTALEGSVRIEAGSKDGLIHLSATDRDPQRAAQMANGYVEEFKKFSATLAVTEASQRRLFFERQLSQAKENLADAEEKLKRTEQATGVLQIDAQTRAVIESVAQLRAQIAAKQVQLRAMRQSSTGQNPVVQVAEEELAALEAQQKALGASSDGTADAFLIPRGKMQQTNIDYIRKYRDVRYYETIFELLARQFEIAKLDEARQGVEVQVVDRATVPDHHSYPKRTFTVLGAAFFGVFLGVTWALAAEGLARLSRNPSERERLHTLRESLAFKRRSRA
jgi:uncharacterized protein involved in exopolysaccharide biosynthesis